MSKTILVTGGAGFIGSNLIRQLLDNPDNEVINLDKMTYAGNLDSLKDVANNSRYRFEQVDLVDSTAIIEIMECHKPEAVMHLAAESHVDRSIDGPGAFIQTNIIGTFNLLQASLKYWQAQGRPAGFRFLHVSTDEVYGSLGLDDPAFTEGNAYDPHSPYSASKAASDHLARAWHTTYGLPVMVTNCSNNYGPYQFPEKLIPLVILKCLHLKHIPVYGTGENVRDWLYVEDHAEALCRVLAGGNVGETYNIGGDNELSNIELVRKLCTILDDLRPLSQEEDIKSYADLITFVDDRPGHDLRYGIDASKIRRELGWSSVEDSESGFRKTVLWYLENNDWWERVLSDDYRLERLGTTP